MALARFTATVQDAEGNAVPGCGIEVRSETTGLLVPLFSDREGTVALGNPYASADATFKFHAAGGAYQVTAIKGVFQSIWRFVAIGTAAEVDYEDLVFELGAGIYPTTTRAELLAFSPVEGQSIAGVVLADTNPAFNGYYRWSGTTWVRLRGLPDTLASLTVTGGTRNAIQAQASAGVDPGLVKAFWIDVPTTNTGNVTIAINGGPARSARDVNGNHFASGVFTGRMFFSVEANNTYRAILGGDYLAAVAATAANAAAAQGSADAAALAAASAEFKNYGIGSGPLSIDDFATEAANLGAVFRALGSALNGPPGGPSMSGVIAPLSGTPRVEYIGVTPTGDVWIGDKNGATSVPTWRKLLTKGLRMKQTIITSSGAHTFDPLCSAFTVDLVGGGAGGAGTNTSSNQGSACPGGGAGADFSGMVTGAIPASATIVIGAGGNPNAQGGQSSYNDGTRTVTCPGGRVGTAAAGNGTPTGIGALPITPTYNGWGGSTNTIILANGEGSDDAQGYGAAQFGNSRCTSEGTPGGNTRFGKGGARVTQSDTSSFVKSGNSGTGYGSGGSGPAPGQGGNNSSGGGSGRPGLCIITEWIKE